jgi:AsmA protein
MKTLFKVVGATLAVIATLAVVIGIAVWLLFDPNDYKDYLSEWVSERTGREFVIEDDLELTFFPWLGITTGNVRMGNAAGFGDDDFASIDSATVSVRLLPLLSRRVEIGTVRLDGLELNLATDAQGSNNWSDLIAAGESGDAGEPEDAPAAAPFLDQLNIAGIDINDGLIFWRENATEVRYVISELSLETEEIAAGAPIDAQLAFRLVSIEPQLTAEITASGAAFMDSAAARLEGRNLTVVFNLTDGGGNERAAGTLQTGNLGFGLETRNAEIAQGSLTATVIAPPVGPEQLELAADWSALRLDLTEATLAFDDLNTVAAGIAAAWELSGRNLLDQPELEGRVSIAGAPLQAALDALGLELDPAARGGLGNFDLSAAFVAQPATRSLALSSLSAALLGVALEGEFTAAADGSASGRFATNEFDPARLMPLLPADTAASIDAGALGAARISSQVRYQPEQQRLSLENIDAGILGARITGELHRLDDGSSYEGRLSVPSLSGERLTAALGERMPEALATADLGTLALRARFDYLSGAGTLELSELDAEAAGLRMLGSLRMTQLPDSQSWAGNLELRPFDPKALLARLNQPAPALADSTAFKTASLSAELDVDATRGVFTDIQLRLDDSTVTGDVTVAFSEPVAYEFRLEIDRLDADRYLPPTPDAPAAAPAAVADVTLPTQPLYDLNLAGELSVGELGLANLSFSNLSSRLTVRDGLGVVEDARTELYGGAFQGRVELDARGELPRLAVNGAATTIQLEPLLAALRGEANMTGAGSFDLSLAGTGARLTSVLDSSQGRVEFSVRDGTLRGFNLGHALCSAYNVTQSLPRPAAAEELTRFQLIRGRAEVQEGIARTRDLEATTAFLKVTGQGQSDIVSRDINYDLVAEMTASIGIPRCETMDRAIGDSIPMRVSGTITAPEIQPDFRQLVRDRVRGELEDRLRQRLEERLR